MNEKQLKQFEKDVQLCTQALNEKVDRIQRVTKSYPESDEFYVARKHKFFSSPEAHCTEKYGAKRGLIYKHGMFGRLNEQIPSDYLGTIPVYMSDFEKIFEGEWPISRSSKQWKKPFPYNGSDRLNRIKNELIYDDWFTYQMVNTETELSSKDVIHTFYTDNSTEKLSSKHILEYPCQVIGPSVSQLKMIVKLLCTGEVSHELFLYDSEIKTIQDVTCTDVEVSARCHTKQWTPLLKLYVNFAKKDEKVVIAKKNDDGTITLEPYTITKVFTKNPNENLGPNYGNSIGLDKQQYFVTLRSLNKRTFRDLEIYDFQDVFLREGTHVEKLEFAYIQSPQQLLAENILEDSIVKQCLRIISGSLDKKKVAPLIIQSLKNTTAEHIGRNERSAALSQSKTLLTVEWEKWNHLYTLLVGTQISDDACATYFDDSNKIDQKFMFFQKLSKIGSEIEGVIPLPVLHQLVRLSLQSAIPTNILKSIPEYFYNKLNFSAKDKTKTVAELVLPDPEKTQNFKKLNHVDPGDDRYAIGSTCDFQDFQNDLKNLCKNGTAKYGRSPLIWISLSDIFMPDITKELFKYKDEMEEIFQEIFDCLTESFQKTIDFLFIVLKLFFTHGKKILEGAGSGAGASKGNGLEGAINPETSTRIENSWLLKVPALLGAGVSIYSNLDTKKLLNSVSNSSTILSLLVLALTFENIRKLVLQILNVFNYKIVKEFIVGFMIVSLIYNACYIDPNSDISSLFDRGIEFATQCMFAVFPEFLQKNFLKSFLKMYMSFFTGKLYRVSGRLQVNLNIVTKFCSAASRYSNNKKYDFVQKKLEIARKKRDQDLKRLQAFVSKNN